MCDKYVFSADLFAQIKNLQKRGVSSKTIDVMFRFFGSRTYLLTVTEINDKDPGNVLYLDNLPVIGVPITITEEGLQSFLDIFHLAYKIDNMTAVFFGCN